MRPQTWSQIYLHFVWATYRRQALVTPEIEALLYPYLLDQSRTMGCEVLAVGGMPDHVHLAVRAGTPVAPAQLVKRLKGASAAASRTWAIEPVVRWQDGYGVFSFSRSHLDRVVAYIRNQRHHHADEAMLWAPWENAGERAATVIAPPSL